MTNGTLSPAGEPDLASFGVVVMDEAHAHHRHRGILLGLDRPGCRTFNRPD
jgi:hypothetical protein